MIWNEQSNRVYRKQQETKLTDFILKRTSKIKKDKTQILFEDRHYTWWDSWSV